MTLSSDGKAQIIAAILTSPVMMKILEQYPVAKYDDPKELAPAIATFAKAIIAEAESKIP